MSETLIAAVKGGAKKKSARSVARQGQNRTGVFGNMLEKIAKETQTRVAVLTEKNGQTGVRETRGTGSAERASLRQQGKAAAQEDRTEREIARQSEVPIEASRLLASVQAAEQLRTEKNQRTAGSEMPQGRTEALQTIASEGVHAGMPSQTLVARRENTRSRGVAEQPQRAEAGGSQKSRGRQDNGRAQDEGIELDNPIRGKNRQEIQRQTRLDQAQTIQPAQLAAEQQKQASYEKQVADAGRSISIEIDASRAILEDLRAQENSAGRGAGRSDRAVLGNAGRAELASMLREFGNGQVVQQAAIVLPTAGAGEIHLNLRPAELGSVRFKLEIKDSLIQGVIQVENESVREVFEQNLADLTRSFEEKGFTVGQLSLEVAADHQKDQRPDSGRLSSRTKDAAQDRAENRVYEVISVSSTVNMLA